MGKLYLHPDYQSLSSKRSYRKTFDIYSFGLILLEIAHWTKIEQIVNIDPHSTPFAELKGMRSKLLRSKPESLARVRASCGDRYYGAVKSCLEGGAAFGIDDDANEASAETGAKLQQGFTRLVIDALEQIRYQDVELC